MSANMETPAWLQDKVLRTLFWGGAAALFAIPVIARLTVNIPWTGSDFVVWGVMLAVAASACELALRLSRNNFYRAGMVLAAGAGFFTTWVNLAVGIIESELHDWNLLYFGVLAIGILGAPIMRFRSDRLSLLLVCMAIAQVIVGVVAFFVSLPGHPEGWLFSIFLTAVWLACAWLFGAAARATSGIR